VALHRIELGETMKRLFIVAAAVLATTSFASAEAVDMSTITCGEVMAGTGDDAGNLLIWLDGWLAGQADNTMLDEAELGAQIEGILGICQENPNMSLMNAGKQYVGG
jgi:acid stress chaperone HdeB